MNSKQKERRETQCSPNGKTAKIHFWETYSVKSRSAKALSSSVKFFPAWYDGKNEVYQNKRKLHPIVWTIQDTDVVFVFPGMEKNKIPSKIVRIANQLFTLRRKGGTSQSRAKWKRVLAKGEKSFKLISCIFTHIYLFHLRYLSLANSHCF